MRTSMLAAVVAAGAFAGVTHAKTFSFPHVLETSGRITGTPFSFDTTIFAMSTLDFDETDDGDPNNNYYTKKHIGNVKYEEISFATGQKLSLTLDISDINETFDTTLFRTSFSITFHGTFTDNGVVTPISSFDLSVFGFDPVPLSAEARMSPYVVTLPSFNMVIDGTSTVFAEFDAGSSFTIIPAPSAAVVFGAGALVAARRRRPE